jgi:hypothetical protein
MFTFFGKFVKKSPQFLATFPQSKDYALILIKNVLGCILGYFFPKCRLCINFEKKWLGLHFGRFSHSSGHPAKD